MKNLRFRLFSVRSLPQAALVMVVCSAASVSAQDRDTPLVPPNPVLPPALEQPRSERSSVRSVVRPPNPVPPPGQTASETPVQPPAEQEEAAAPAPDPTPMPDASACFADLEALDVIFERRGRHEGEGRCGIDNAVSVSAIGDTRLEPAALLTCTTARTFANFLREELAGVAQQSGFGRPQLAYVAASYACRGRNNVEGARLSEHSYGRAIDIRAITFADGQTWHVAPRSRGSSEPEALFQRGFRQAACGPFNTVLGPGSDGFHEDHIHMDNAIRSSTYCR